ncbi:hypothetical protein EVAR_18224_1 [Eumeta japonica]|uniref:Uncharacterized protein n=1 Tax=Eumeta variegata TaxID=151549 RepID=A0A4C1UKG7_EUMVA|nr:hypothetical protein EVAR_18224_1 [Eumeta japonica]
MPFPRTLDGRRTDPIYRLHRTGSIKGFCVSAESITWRGGAPRVEIAYLGACERARRPRVLGGPGFPRRVCFRVAAVAEHRGISLELLSSSRASRSELTTPNGASRILNAAAWISSCSERLGVQGRAWAIVT